MQLLVSVVHADEVEPAVEGGADIVDIKNPSEGSLGANFPHVIRRVRELTPARVPVSAAIGDAPNLPGLLSLAAAGAATCGVQYIKVGLLGVRESADALILLTEVCRAARAQDPDVRVMTAAYADAHRIGSLPPSQLPAVAAAAGAHGCMVDTASKAGGTLLTELCPEELGDFIALCRDNGLLCALAGSLRVEDVPLMRELSPDIIGVRTAACVGGREGRVDRDMVSRLKGSLAETGPLRPDPFASTPPAAPAARR